MAEDEKNKVTSLPPPPTDEIDDEWGSSGSAASKPRNERPLHKSEKTEPGAVKARSPRPDEEEDEEDEDEEYERDEDEDDEEDDDDEDDDDRRPVRRAVAKNAEPRRGDWLPDWAPWATLGGLLVIGFLGGVGVIPLNFNLTKAAAEPVASTASTSTTAKPSAAARTAPAAAGSADQERIAASHLLVQYKGALRAAPTITRTKEEAKKRAEEALAKARKGEPFDKLVAEYSDEPNAAARGGKLGRFPRQGMVKPFADAAFALKPGQISDVVETQFGYHVILRTE